MSKITRLTLDQFKKEQPSESDNVMIAKVSPVEASAKAIGEESKRTLRVIVSTGAVDRSGDTVDPNGWDLKRFKKQGVVLWAHESDLLPIANPIETWSDGKKLRGTAKFTPADMGHQCGDGFGFTVYRMFVEGYLKNISAGFLPKKWEVTEDENQVDRWGYPGIDFKKQELIEWSPVPIGANQECYFEAEEKGIDLSPLYTWTEHALDTGSCLIVPQKTLEEYHSFFKQWAPKGNSMKDKEKKEKEAEAKAKALAEIKAKALAEKEAKELKDLKEKEVKDNIDRAKRLTEMLKDRRKLALDFEDAVIATACELIKSLDGTCSEDGLKSLREAVAPFAGIKEAKAVTNSDDDDNDEDGITNEEVVKVISDEINKIFDDLDVDKIVEKEARKINGSLD